MKDEYTYRWTSKFSTDEFSQLWVDTVDTRVQCGTCRHLVNKGDEVEHADLHARTTLRRDPDVP